MMKKAIILLAGVVWATSSGVLAATNPSPAWVMGTIENRKALFNQAKARHLQGIEAIQTESLLMELSHNQIEPNPTKEIRQ